MKTIMSDKKFFISVAVLIVLIILASVFGYLNMAHGSSVSVASAESARSTPDGIEVVSDTKTMYYLDIPCKGVSGYLDMYPSDEVVVANKQFNDYYDGIAAAKTPVTFLFVFNKVLVNNRPLLATWNLPIEFSHGSGTHTGEIMKSAYRSNGKPVKLAKITFADNARINIRQEYYERFKDADFSDISITHLYNGSGYYMYNEHTAALGSSQFFDYNCNEVLYYSFDGVQVRDETVPEDYDPIVDEGQAPDNGGVVDSPVETLEQKLGLDGGWKWWQILLACVGVVVGIIFLPWIVKLLIWLIKLPIKLIAWIIGSVKK